MGAVTRFNRPSTALIPLPRCPNQMHAHLPMVLSGGHTPEQRFVGTHYRCQLCASGVIFQSPALRRQLAEQKWRIRADVRAARAA